MLLFLFILCAQMGAGSHQVIPVALPDLDGHFDAEVVEVVVWAPDQATILFEDSENRIWNLAGIPLLFLGGDRQPLNETLAQSRIGYLQIYRDGEALLAEKMVIYPQRDLVQFDPAQSETLWQKLGAFSPDSGYLSQVANFLAGNTQTLNVLGSSFSTLGYGTIASGGYLFPTEVRYPTNNGILLTSLEPGTGIPHGLLLSPLLSTITADGKPLTTHTLRIGGNNAWFSSNAFGSVILAGGSRIDNQDAPVYSFNPFATLIGGYSNRVDNAVPWAGAFGTVVGGHDNSIHGFGGAIFSGTSNQCYGKWSSIIGGNNNYTDGENGFTGSGEFNRVFGKNNVVVGGRGHEAYGSETGILAGSQNEVDGEDSVVLGGRSNSATGDSSAVLAGYDCAASQANTLAVGYQANALHSGSMVFSTRLGGLTSTDSNQFLVRANKFWFGSSASPTFTGLINTSTGAYLSTGGTWTNTCDKNAKTGFLTVDGATILEKLDALPIQSWHYKAEDSSIQHLGPTAQDFHATFGLGGEDDTHIATVDSDGVALLASKALYQRIREQDQKIAALEQQLQALIAAQNQP
ncbi:MAG: tail fiber domain-containing protein [Acidobacteria bacterium]|nr:tail fiber domain-containing protein [Acidobacteriota bacterium]MCB9398635.1 tail fiber domain-containing protein [Acidobacteriota bacterium]